MIKNIKVFFKIRLVHYLLARAVLVRGLCLGNKSFSIRFFTIASVI